MSGGPYADTLAAPALTEALWVYDDPGAAGEAAKELRAAIRNWGLEQAWAVRCTTRVVRAFNQGARVYVIAQVRR